MFSLPTHFFFSVLSVSPLCLTANTRHPKEGRMQAGRQPDTYLAEMTFVVSARMGICM